MIFSGRRRRLLKTGQTTSYFRGDDGDYEVGGDKGYTVLSAGDYSGTINADVASYAAATLAFVNATSKITDSANGLAHIKTGDTIVVKGSTANDGVYTVATGAVAGEIVTTEALTDEGAAAYVSLYKRAAQSNNAVLNQPTGEMWHRYVSTGKIGPASDGKLNWYNAATCFTLHPAAADLAIVAGNILRVEGGDESTRYHVGDVLVCSGFADADNNLPGLVVVSSSFTGGNTDIVVSPIETAVAVEAAGGARTIKLVCQNIFQYCAACNAASLGGYTDWRVANVFESRALMGALAPATASTVPNLAAFPGWPASGKVWTSTSRVAAAPTQAIGLFYGGTYGDQEDAWTIASYCALVRGGI